MTTINFGVLDVPYTNEDEAAKTPKQLRRDRRNNILTSLGLKEFHGTTGDIAEILEDKYHVMEIFIEEVGLGKILQAMEHSAQNALEDLFAGRPPGEISLTLEAEEEIIEAFRAFIDQREMDGIQPGVPTDASLKGVNHRLKHPYAKDNPVRPSFKDTGLYMDSARAWTED